MGKKSRRVRTGGGKTQESTTAPQQSASAPSAAAAISQPRIQRQIQPASALPDFGPPPSTYTDNALPQQCEDPHTTPAGFKAPISGSGSTALIAASANGHIDTVNYLLASGANPSTCDTYARSPLLVASSNGHLEVVTALLEAGAPLDYVEVSLASPLMAAMANRHIEVAKTLYKRGARLSCGTSGCRRCRLYTKQIESVLAKDSPDEIVEWEEDRESPQGTTTNESQAEQTHVDEDESIDDIFGGPDLFEQMLQQTKNDFRQKYGEGYRPNLADR